MLQTGTCGAVQLEAAWCFASHSGLYIACNAPAYKILQSQQFYKGYFGNHTPYSNPNSSSDRISEKWPPMCCFQPATTECEQIPSHRHFYVSDSTSHAAQWHLCVD